MCVDMCMQKWRITLGSVLFCFDAGGKDQTLVVRIAWQELEAACPSCCSECTSYFLLSPAPPPLRKTESHYIALGDFQSRAILLPQLPSWTPLSLALYKQFSDLCQFNMKIYFQGLWPWRCLNTSLGKNSEFFLQGIICILSYSYNFFLLPLLFFETWYHCVVQPDFELKIILLLSSELSLGPQVCATTPSFDIKKYYLEVEFPQLVSFFDFAVSFSNCDLCT